MDHNLQCGGQIAAAAQPDQNFESLSMGTTILSEWFFRYMSEQRLPFRLFFFHVFG